MRKSFLLSTAKKRGIEENEITLKSNLETVP